MLVCLLGAFAPPSSASESITFQGNPLLCGPLRPCVGVGGSRRCWRHGRCRVDWRARVEQWFYCAWRVAVMTRHRRDSNTRNESIIEQGAAGSVAWRDSNGVLRRASIPRNSISYNLLNWSDSSKLHEMMLLHVHVRVVHVRVDVYRRSIHLVEYAEKLMRT